MESVNVGYFEVNLVFNGAPVELLESSRWNGL